MRSLWFTDIHHINPEVFTLPCALAIPGLTLALRKMCSYLELFWYAFPAFGLNVQRYGVSLRIQSDYRKIRNSENGHFSCSASPFLLNVTIKHHLEKYLHLTEFKEVIPKFIFIC